MATKNISVKFDGDRRFVAPTHRWLYCHGYRAPRKPPHADGNAFRSVGGARGTMWFPSWKRKNNRCILSH